jgi:hypothetical protein
MPIKLKSTGGGDVTLDVPFTASTYTLTLPAQTGTVITSDGSNNVSVAGNLSFNSGYGSAAVAYGCRAWVNFNGTGTVAIRASGNVTSITDNGTGDYTVNFTTAMPDANYAPAGVVDNGDVSAFWLKPVTYSTGSFRFRAGNTTLNYDPTVASVEFFR